MKMTTNDRLVLLAVQNARQGLNALGIALITNLPLAEVEASLGTLSADDLIARETASGMGQFIPNVIPLGPACFSFNTWLRDFWSLDPPTVHADTLGTTYLSCGAVILASLASGSVDPDLVEQATSLPLGYVEFVLSLMLAQNAWSLDSVRDLRRLLRNEPPDFAGIQLALRDATEDFWELCWTPEVHETLEQFRAGCQVGGNSDEWVDEE